MRILHIMDFCPSRRGAFESYLVGLSTECLRRGMESHFVFSGQPCDGFLSALPESATVNTTVGPPLVTQFQECVRIARRLEPCLTTYTFMSMFSPRMLAMHSLVRGKHVFVDQTSADVRARRATSKALAFLRGGLYSRIYDRVVSVSNVNRARNVTKSFILPERNIVIYNGVFGQQYSAQKVSGARIFYAGQITKEKGVFTLIEAFAGLVNQHRFSHFSLWLAGEGRDRAAAESHAERFGVAARVDFLGARDDVQNLMREATVNVIPSEWPEAFGFTVVEAMLADRPLIVSDAGAIPEVVGDTARIIPAGNAAALTEALISAAMDPLGSESLAAKAHRRAVDVFSGERMVSQYADLFCELLEPEGALRRTSKQGSKQ